MGLSFRVFGTNDVIPAIDEITDLLEESEFDISVETEEDEDEESWSSFLLFEGSVDEPINVFRIESSDAIDEELEKIRELISDEDKDAKDLVHTLENCVVVFGIDLPDDIEDDDNALMVGSLVSQFLAQRTDGVYAVDSEGIFNDAGDLIYEMIQEE